MLVPAILTNQPPLNKNGGFLVCPILIAKEGDHCSFLLSVLTLNVIISMITANKS